MSEIVTDLGQNKPWRAWKHGDNPWTINLFEDAAHTIPFSLVSYVFTLNIYANSNTKGTPKLVLTEGSGLTNSGADGTLEIMLTKAQAVALKGNDFFYVLSYVTSSQTYRIYQGPLTLQTGNNPGIAAYVTSDQVILTGEGGVDNLSESQTQTLITSILTHITTAQKEALVAALIQEIRDTINDA